MNEATIKKAIELGAEITSINNYILDLKKVKAVEVYFIGSDEHSEFMINDEPFIFRLKRRTLSYFYCKLNKCKKQLEEL